MNSHTQIGPIHIFRGTTELVIPDRTDGVSHVRGTEIRLPAAFASRPSVSTTVYSPDGMFRVPATSAGSAGDEEFKLPVSAEPALVIRRVEIQTLGTETQIMIYAINPDQSPVPYPYLCDYVIVGDT